jgi:hypothetical protein
MLHCTTMWKTAILLVFLKIACGDYMDAHRLQDRNHGNFQISNLSGEQRFEPVNYEQHSADNENQSAKSLYRDEKVTCSSELGCAAEAEQQRRKPTSSGYAVLALLSVLAAGTAVRSLLVVRSRTAFGGQRGGRTLRLPTRPTTSTSS